MIRSALIGIAISLGSLLLCALFTPLGKALGPDNVWYQGGTPYAFPAPLLVIGMIVALPSMIAGAPISRLSRSTASRLSGYCGIVLGVCLHAADMVLKLSVGRGSFFSILVFLFPLVYGAAFTLFTNYLASSSGLAIKSAIAHAGIAFFAISLFMFFSFSIGPEGPGCLGYLLLFAIAPGELALGWIRLESDLFLNIKYLVMPPLLWGAIGLVLGKFVANRYAAAKALMQAELNREHSNDQQRSNDGKQDAESEKNDGLGKADSVEVEFDE